MPCDFHLLPHIGVQTLAPYIPGKSAEELAQEKGLTGIIKLASNENPLGCSPLVLQALENLSGKKIATYPVAVRHPLRHKIANQLGIEAAMITLGNGTDSLFTLLLICFALHNNKHILIHDYSFSTYAIQAKTLGIPVNTVPLPNWKVDINAMIAACNQQTALLFLANPNNPVGVLTSYEDLKTLLQGIPDSTIVVLDEAYHEYLEPEDKRNTLDLIALYPNLVITRTFSKAYGLAGLRIGYAIANFNITAILQRVLLPFTVNQAALIAAETALDDKVFLYDTLQTNRQGLKQMTEGLTERGLSLLPATGNFITFDYKQDTSLLYQKLQRHGIIVRPLHPYGLDKYLRVTIGTSQQNSQFLDKLTICMTEG